MPRIPPYVLALDPGKKTGYALHDTTRNEVVACGEGQFDETCDWIEHYVTSPIGPHCQIITERFLITPKTARNSQAPWSLEMIGVARRFARKYTTFDLIVQDVATAKHFSSNERLRALGWWQTGTEGHVNDALRHLLLYLASRGWWDPRLDPTIESTRTS